MVATKAMTNVTIAPPYEGIVVVKTQRTQIKAKCYAQEPEQCVGNQNIFSDGDG
jgi:hypothetical protein